MPEYMICFPDGSMIIPDEDLPDVAAAVNVVIQEAEAAGVWVFGAGLEHQVPSVVAVDGTVTDGPYPESKEHLGGFSIVNVSTREEAIEWAKKLAVACRCAQEVFEVMSDPNA